MGYWVKSTGGSITITPSPPPTDNNIKIETSPLETSKIETSKIETNRIVNLNDKPMFNIKQTIITDENIRFMLLDWYYNKEKTAYIHQHISEWDVSSVTSFEKLFFMMPRFNDDISNWDTSNVTNMSYMFINSKYFNNDVIKWNIEKVVNFTGMFKGINQEFINNYDTNNNIDEYGNTNRHFFN
jgi:surface protein